MNDTQAKASSQQAQQPVQQQSQTQVNQPATPPAQPVGTMLKENIVPIEQSEKELALTQEEVKAGVEKVTESPTLKEEHYKVGIRLAKESTPVLTEPTGAIKLPPMSENEVLK